jgi:hypothetical protein
MPIVTVGTQRAPYAGWRALAATILIMSGATLAHGWAGGALPEWPFLVGLGAATLGASTLFLRGALTSGVLLPVMAGAQVLVHESFMAVSTAGHAGHAHLVDTGAGEGWTSRMVLAHLIVAVVTGLVWRACERTARVVVVLSGIRACYLGAGRPRAGWQVSVVARALSFLVATPHRGPPPALRCAQTWG